MCGTGEKRTGKGAVGCRVLFIEKLIRLHGRLASQRRSQPWLARVVSLRCSVHACVHNIGKRVRQGMLLSRLTISIFIKPLVSLFKPPPAHQLRVSKVPRQLHARPMVCRCCSLLILFSFSSVRLGGVSLVFPFFLFFAHTSYPVHSSHDRISSGCYQRWLRICYVPHTHKGDGTGRTLFFPAAAHAHGK